MTRTGGLKRLLEDELAFIEEDFLHNGIVYNTASIAGPSLDQTAPKHILVNIAFKLQCGSVNVLEPSNALYSVV